MTHIEVLEQMMTNTGESGDLNLRDYEVRALRLAIAGAKDYGSTERQTLEGLLISDDVDLTTTERQAVEWAMGITSQQA